MVGALRSAPHPRRESRPGEIDALDMVWRGGARAVGLDGALGAVRAGYRADLVTIDVESPAYSGSSTLRRSLVFAGTPADVRSVGRR